MTAYDGLTDDLKEAYSFVIKYKDLIMELSAIIDCMEYVEYRCKHEGLSLELSEFLIWHITKSLVIADGRTSRMLRVGIDMFDYLKRECALLKSRQEKHIISSDIIESCFGTFKSTKSPDKLCGVTKHILVLPLALKFKSKNERMTFDFKSTMERVHYADLKEWKDFNLNVENQTMERKDILRKVI